MRSRLTARMADRISGSDTASRRYLMYVVIPLWFVPGVLDYLLHRRSRIEDTSGPMESLIHLTMMAEVGVPTWLGLLCEINPGLIVVMGALAILHNASSVLDQRTAVNGGRELSSTEMSVHSYLESLPFVALGTVCCLHWDELRRVARPGPGWLRLERKHTPLPAGYLAAVAAGTLGLIAIPMQRKCSAACSPPAAGPCPYRPWCAEDHVRDATGIVRERRSAGARRSPCATPAAPG